MTMIVGNGEKGKEAKFNPL